MNATIFQWSRVESCNTPIYIRQDTPDWIVPNTAGDQLLMAIMGKGERARFGNNDVDHLSLDTIMASPFLSLFSSPETQSYPGRDTVLKLEKLEECWLHITDRCNLSCSHCLFSCSPKTKATLSYDCVAETVRAAYRLGTRVFYLTGGEPLLHPDFQKICRFILNNHEDTQLVILTNGTRIPAQLNFFKTLPQKRLFLQISVDGIGEIHENLRGKGTYQKLQDVFGLLCATGIHTTLSMAIHSGNCHQMKDVVALAAKYDFSGVHYMWLLIIGKATPRDFVPPDDLFEQLIRAQQAAEHYHITIDNISNLSTQVFSTPGTKYDLSNAGWRSLAIGPDGNVYPTPALIGQADVRCGNISKENLESIWRFSEVLKKLRSCSIVQDKSNANDPLKYIVGGGDIDHSYYSGGSFFGHDPYLPLYNQLALWLMAESTKWVPADSPMPRIRRKMGEKLMHCVENGEGVALTHSNCVLTLAGTHSVVGDFYAKADASDNEEILNPVCYPNDVLGHIPVDARVRSYGCGSPVLDAGIIPGNVVVDLGSGAGVECFIAARMVGPQGHVIGVDMLDHMIDKANAFVDDVAHTIGCRNVEFKKGYLEHIPVDDQTVDVIISNCVINLSEDKRQTFAEIFRILKPGGRICISDVVTDKPCPPAIQNDAKLRGECIAGALVQPHLMTILESTGFNQIRMIKRFFYRRVQNHDFFSITYTACKPSAGSMQSVVYPGPYAAVITDTGDVLLRGKTTEMNWPYPADGDASIFTLDTAGNVTNVAMENTCDCSAPPGIENDCNCGSSPEAALKTGSMPFTDKIPKSSTAPPLIGSAKSMTGCMVCGKPLRYVEQERREHCVFCNERLSANAVCEDGHFVCDNCHSRDAIKITRHICTHTDADDMIDLLNQLRRHPSFPLHGPEHHFAVPGVILACYKNLGGAVTTEDILAAIDRGQGVPGGVCGFWGTCGAAIGVGIAFGMILKSNPLTPKPRQFVQQITAAAIKEISVYEAGRCCQREAWTALKVAAGLSETYLPIKLKAKGDVQCAQQAMNKECIGRNCPYFKSSQI